LSLHPFGRRFRPRAFVRYLRLAFPILFGRPLADRHLLYYLSNRADLAQGFSEIASEMPQARLVDDTVQYADMDLRVHFSARLRGRGLDLGALHRPLPTHEAMRVTYVDRADLPTLKAQFAPVADAIVEPDVIDDAQTLGTFGDATQDFVIAAHIIEHMRDPIGAMANWLRVLKPGGLLYLIVPDKRLTFDRARVRTTLEHVVLDHEEPSAARDFEHFLDYARFVHDKAGVEAIAEARRLEREDYSIHFHTFIPSDMVALVGWVAGHVAPIENVEGPLVNPEPHDDHVEFHLLARRPVPA
jgi:predicted SAM-dependent methyltransferase